MRSPLIRLLAAVLALSLVAAACSDDDGDESSDTSAEESSSTSDESSDSTEASMDDVAGSESIAAIAAGNEDFSTLVTALEAAGLVETLSGDGEYTVFAPTNAAFEALPAGTLDTLLADPEGQLTDVLTYHVYEGTAMAEDVTQLDGQDLTMLNGGTVTVGVTDAGVTLTDAQGNAVNVVETDIVASNGVIHVIDAVLLPAA
jgi:uncharacterized surface protein with fasciclin (FAS1) repeats